MNLESCPLAGERFKPLSHLSITLKFRLYLTDTLSKGWVLRHPPLMIFLVKIPSEPLSKIPGTTPLLVFYFISQKT